MAGNISLAVVARNDMVTQCSTDTSAQWLYGIATIQNQEPTRDISFYQVPQNAPIPDPLPSVMYCWVKGEYIAYREQFQLQNVNDGTDPERILVVTQPLLYVAEGSTVPANGVVCATDVETGTVLLADFVQPAVSGTVTANLDTSWMTVSTEVHVTGAGIFTVTTITDATHAVLTFTGVASALVKIAA